MSDLKLSTQAVVRNNVTVYRGLLDVESKLLFINVFESNKAYHINYEIVDDKLHNEDVSGIILGISLVTYGYSDLHNSIRSSMHLFVYNDDIYCNFVCNRSKRFSGVSYIEQVRQNEHPKFSAIRILYEPRNSTTKDRYADVNPVNDGWAIRVYRDELYFDDFCEMINITYPTIGLYREKVELFDILNNQIASLAKSI